MTETRSYDLTWTEIFYEIGGVSYVLREASEDAARKFNNKRSELAKFSRGKLSAVTGLGDLEPYLVSLCLFRAVSSGAPAPEESQKLTPVAFNTILGWPARIVKPIFEEAKRISDLEDLEDLTSLKKQLQETQEKIADLEEAEVDTTAKNELGS